MGVASLKEVGFAARRNALRKKNTRKDRVFFFSAYPFARAIAPLHNTAATEAPRAVCGAINARRSGIPERRKPHLFERVNALDVVGCTFDVCVLGKRVVVVRLDAVDESVVRRVASFEVALCHFPAHHERMNRSNVVKFETGTLPLQTKKERGPHYWHEVNEKRG